MKDLKSLIVDVPDFPKPGILFRDIGPLLRSEFNAAIDAVDALLTEAQWREVDLIAGIESRGFMLASALTYKRRKGFVAIRKRGKLPPPVHIASYSLEYGDDHLEVRPGAGRVLIVDDVFATGGTLGAAVSLCRDAGFQPAGVVTLIDIGINPRAFAALNVRTVIRYG